MIIEVARKGGDIHGRGCNDVGLAKRFFQTHGAAADGPVIFRRKLPRDRLLSFLADQPRCIVAMEACATSHGWGRGIERLGHSVRLFPPTYVKPFVKRQKNDAADAEAIAEAASRPIMYYPAGDACIAKRAVCNDQDGGATGACDAVRTRDLLVRQRMQTIDASCQRHASGVTRSSRQTRRRRATGGCSGETAG